jgi:hypothetical protein
MNFVYKKQLASFVKKSGIYNQLGMNKPTLGVK